MGKINKKLREISGIIQLIMIHSIEYTKQIKE